MCTKDIYNGLHKCIVHKLKKFGIITYPLLKNQSQFRISKSLKFLRESNYIIPIYYSQNTNLLKTEKQMF